MYSASDAEVTRRLTVALLGPYVSRPRVARSCGNPMELQVLIFRARYIRELDRHRIACHAAHNEKGGKRVPPLPVVLVNHAQKQLTT